MKSSGKTLTGRMTRLAVFAFAAFALCTGAVQWGTADVSANHPVLVEGNCDSPVPGTTVVPTVTGTGGSTSGGICGDFDGDGRIGTAEDTDGADRIFGTLSAALGPGTGAAAGTGANHNGRIIIVASGRFAEQLFIGQNVGGPGAGGVASPGNVTIEAAPGVQADIDAVLQGDPAGGNNARQGGVAMIINYPSAAGPRNVTLRNLVFRNWSDAVSVTGDGARVHVDRCQFENNLSNGIHIISGRLVVTNTHFDGNGLRVAPGIDNTPNPGNGILVEFNSQVRVADSVFSHNAGAGIDNRTGNTANVNLYKVAFFFNNPDLGTSGATVASNPNVSF